MASPLSVERRALLTRRFQLVLAHIGARSAPQLQAIWENLDSYDEDQIPEFARKAQPILTAAKSVSVSHAIGYYSLIAGVAPVSVSTRAVRATANPRDPFISTWNALASGSSYDDAVAAGAGRTDALARDLVASASRQTGDVVVERANLRVVGWERVPDDGACPWCLEVAPGFYHTAESADFGHERCGCTAEPIFA